MIIFYLQVLLVIYCIIIFGVDLSLMTKVGRKYFIHDKSKFFFLPVDAGILLKIQYT